MPRTRDLCKCSPEQVQDFLNSFDVVMSDCDGVIWHIDTPIEGAVEVLERLQDLGKRLFFVSNNSSISLDRYREKIRKEGFEVKNDQIINTSKVIAWYLNKVDFHGEAFVIATQAFRKVLTDAGVQLAPEDPFIVETDQMRSIKSVEDQPSIKAVITDFNPFCDWAKLALAISCLKRKEVIYLCGARDEWVVYGYGKKILGPGPLIDVVSKQSGRAPIDCAKPSLVLKDYLLEQCKLHNPRRCLFIGDTVQHDMKFATMCGFLKLFVGTGCDNLDDAVKDNETCPDYYISSLGQLRPILDTLRTRTPSNKDS